MNKVYTLILTAIVFLTVGCRSYSSYSLKVKEDKISTKLKPVELKVNICSSPHIKIYSKIIKIRNK